MVNEKGLDCFYDSIENRKLCCAIRKVHPMNKMLKTLDGWITGLRNDQNQNRSTAKMLEIDEMHDNIVKVNPLINWTYEQTWDYVKTNNCPYNKLLDEGYLVLVVNHVQDQSRSVRILEQVVGGGKMMNTKSVGFI